jgi:4-diphosphocytidyl-2-C-methyl-D-erythritol kinase
MTARRARAGAEAPHIWRAPAKVNLTLHILGRRDDGWHELDSIVAFAACADFLSFAPGPRLELSLEGPTAQAAGLSQNNLVLRAAKLLSERVPQLRLGRFRLRKFLPVAAGLGGGSADAAAALRALADANRLARDDENVLAAARECGADTLVCLDPRARVMAGLGEKLSAPLRLPTLHAVLANSGVAVPTADVFARLGLAKGASTGAGPSPNLRIAPTRDEVFAVLRGGRNDMESAAQAIAPAIGEVLEMLRAAKALISRMSGSGATCFGLFENRAASLAAAREIARARPQWWVKATILR